MECRLGNAVSPWHYKRGWHITSTCGVFGAAAAAGEGPGIRREAHLWALGNASAQSSGLVETLGTMAKSIGVGASARGGLRPRCSPGRRRRTRPSRSPDRAASRPSWEMPPTPRHIVKGLGETWEIMANTHKPYPCGVVLFPVIDACLELRAQNPGLTPDAIASIRVEGHSLLRERTDRPSVTTGREAQVSAQHSVAAVLIQGLAGVAQYEDACVNSPDILALRKKVQVGDRPGTAVEAAHVTITLADGKMMIGLWSSKAAGRRKRPMSDAEIESEGARAGALRVSGPRSRRR